MRVFRSRLRSHGALTRLRSLDRERRASRFNPEARRLDTSFSFCDLPPPPAVVVGYRPHGNLGTGAFGRLSRPRHNGSSCVGRSTAEPLPLLCRMSENGPRWIEKEPLCHFAGILAHTFSLSAQALK